MTPPIITLTTDFGMSDNYVGTMKGVILGICPQAQLVDITHAVAPQDVAAAARLLPTFVPFFPAGTIHIVVVDPGVGSNRRALAIATPHALLVAPDNGVLTAVWREAQTRYSAHEVVAVELTEPRFWRPERSMTFHGRDVFAPVAAHLAAGVPIQALGRVLTTIVELPPQEPTLTSDGTLVGQISAIDHFGNCISTIMAEHLASFGSLASVTLRVGDTLLRGIHTTYADVALGEPLALIGSSGELEVAVRNGNAAHVLGIVAGTPIYVLSSTNVPGK